MTSSTGMLAVGHRTPIAVHLQTQARFVEYLVIDGWGSAMNKNSQNPKEHALDIGRSLSHIYRLEERLTRSCTAWLLRKDTRVITGCATALLG